MKYKIGDKFIVEIEETADCNCEPYRLYKMKGFNALVFDDNGLDKLESAEILNELRDENNKLRFEIEGQKEDISGWKIITNARESKIMNLNQKLDSALREIFSLQVEIKKLKDREGSCGYDEKSDNKKHELNRWKESDKRLRYELESQKKYYVNKIKALECLMQRQIRTLDGWYGVAKKYAEKYGSLEIEPEEFWGSPDKFEGREEGSGYTGRVVCIKDNNKNFDKGRVYAVMGGIIYNEIGIGAPFYEEFKTFEDLNKYMNQIFIELVE